MLKLNATVPLFNVAGIELPSDHENPQFLWQAIAIALAYPPTLHNNDN